MDILCHLTIGSNRTYGFAATRAYVAYHDDVFLQYAFDSWNSGRSYTMSDADIKAARMPLKTVELIPECNNGK
jgi:hypothetical protein